MNARREFELRGVHVLWAMLAFFGAIIAVNLAFAAIAVRSFPGEDVRRSYLQGLEYNRTLAERRTQAALGWQVTAFLAEGPAVEVALRTREGRLLDGLSLRGDLQRPTDARLDRALSFEPVGPGRYRAHMADLPQGVWRLRARAANAQGEALDFELELAWSEQR